MRLLRGILMKQDREKEIKREMYLHNEVIKQEKKQLKELKRQLEELQSRNKANAVRKRKKY